MTGTERVARSALAVALLAIAGEAASPGPAAAAVPAPPEAGAYLLDDFKAKVLRPEWRIFGADMRRVESGGDGAIEVSGWRAPAGESAILSLELPELDLRRFGKLAWKGSSTEGPLEGQVLFRFGKGDRLLWTPWKTPKGEASAFEAPLTRFGEENFGLLAPLGGRSRLEFHWKPGAGKVVLDDLRLLPPAKGQPGARFRPPDYLSIAFEKGDGRAIEGRTLTLLTDLQEFHGARGLSLLEKVEEAVQVLVERFGIKPVPEFKGTLLLFRSVAAADAFGERLAERMGHRWTPIPPDLASFGRFGVAMTWLDKGNNPYLPAVAHEALHPLIARALLQAAHSWIQEGLVTSIQRKAYPEHFLSLTGRFVPITNASFVKAMKGQATDLQPLGSLVARPSFGFEDHAQLGSLFDYLATKHRASLPKVWDAVRALEERPDRAGLPAVAGALGLSVQELEADYIRWGASSWK